MLGTDKKVKSFGSEEDLPELMKTENKQVYLISDCPNEIESIPLQDVDTIEVYYYGEAIDEAAIS